MDTKSDGEDAAPDFMTAAEVAAWIRIGVSTVYEWASTDRLPFLKFNGVLRFSRQQLTQWMQQHMRGPSLSSDPVPERAREAHPRSLTLRTMGDAADRVKRRLIPSKNPIHHDDGH